MTDEEKLTLIQKYEDLPEEEKMIQSKLLLPYFTFCKYSKQQAAIEILLQLCREENELHEQKHMMLGCYCGKVVKSLEKSVLSGKDGLARSYAIDSWIYVQIRFVYKREQKLLDI